MNSVHIITATLAFLFGLVGAPPQAPTGYTCADQPAGRQCCTGPYTKPADSNSGGVVPLAQVQFCCTQSASTGATACGEFTAVRKP